MFIYWFDFFFLFFYAQLRLLVNDEVRTSGRKKRILSAPHVSHMCVCTPPTASVHTLVRARARLASPRKHTRDFQNSWQPVIFFNPFIMLLFSFPLFAEEKVNANRNSDMQRKTRSPPPPPSPQIGLGKQERGTFHEESKRFFFSRDRSACLYTRVRALTLMPVRGTWSWKGWLPHHWPRNQ